MSETPEELLEVRIGLASARDIVERASIYALVASGNPAEAAKRTRKAKQAIDKAEAEALEKYFAEVKRA
jgi:hypothetical protein